MTITEAVEHLDLENIAETMRKTGFDCVENVLGSGELAELRTQAHNAVHATGNEYAYLAGEALEGTLIGELGHSSRMNAVLARLYEEAVGAPPAPEEVVHPALRCLLGQTGAAESLRFHFDSYMVTGLLPVVIPTSGRCGDFLYYPNLRRVRRSAAVNVAEKALIQNPASTRLVASNLHRSLQPPRRLELVPGNLYLFWGYRTLHGNDRCDPEQLRATALFHFGDPHRTNPLVRMIQRRVQTRTRRSGPPNGAPSNS